MYTVAYSRAYAFRMYNTFKAPGTGASFPFYAHESSVFSDVRPVLLGCKSFQ